MGDDTDLGWCIVELMGHRRLAGYVSEQQVAGAPMLRIDTPDGDRSVTSLYGPSAVYAIHPTSEATARAFQAGRDTAPVQRWELATLPAGDTDARTNDPDISDPDPIEPEDW